jgi:uncharacterized lipoprotein NlpE involved in copper resistance
MVNTEMKTSIITFALLVSVALVGCDKQSGNKVDANKPVEVNAPGVQVKVGGEGGVEVKAPGVEVETK